MEQYLKNPYYKNLRNNIMIIVIVISFLPMIFVGGLIFTSFKSSYYEKVHAHIKELVNKYAHNINYFLDEKLSDITMLAYSYDIETLKDKNFLDNQLDILRKSYKNVFVDIGLIDSDGIQINYSGPYKFTKADYSESKWFKNSIKSTFSISDVFLGLRGHPHFIIAVRKQINNTTYIIRATIDFMSFNSLVENITMGQTGYAFILNKNAEFQTSRVNNKIDKEFFISCMNKEIEESPGIVKKKDNTGTESLYMMMPLKNGEWFLVYQQTAKDAYRKLNEAQIFSVFIFIFGGIIIIVAAFNMSKKVIVRIIRADKEKEMMNQQVIETGRLASIGELAAGIAHEINNPVAIMIEEAGWMTDLLEEEDTSKIKNIEEFSRSLKQIKTQGRRCKDITYKLLSFARKTDTKTDEVDINDLIKDVIALSHQRAKYEQIKIEADLDQTLPLLKISPSEIQQVLLNLLNNAIDALEDCEKGEIKFTTKQEESKAIITIQDNGSGISEDHIERIFDPFFTTKPVGKGTGLGLSICYGIIKKMKGDINLQSVKGIGTTFIITLPFS